MVVLTRKMEAIAKLIDEKIDAFKNSLVSHVHMIYTCLCVIPIRRVIYSLLSSNIHMIHGFMCNPH